MVLKRFQVDDDSFAIRVACPDIEQAAQGTLQEACQSSDLCWFSAAIEFFSDQFDDRVHPRFIVTSSFFF